MSTAFSLGSASKVEFLQPRSGSRRRVHGPSALRKSNADEAQAILRSAKQCRKRLKAKRETACRHFSLVRVPPHPWPLQARQTGEPSSQKPGHEFSLGDDCYRIRGVICRVPAADLSSSFNDKVNFDTAVRLEFGNIGYLLRGFLFSAERFALAAVGRWASMVSQLSF